MGNQNPQGSLQPIELTAEGDRLLECPCVSMHTKDADQMHFTPGIHEHCGGKIERKKSSVTYDVLVCTTCYLRISIPKHVRTYGELRERLSIQVMKSR